MKSATRKIYRAFMVTMAFVCVVGILSGCDKTSINPEKYTSYICYDYHLKCLETEGEKAITEISYQDDLTNNEYKQKAWFQKIVGESDDTFIYAEVLSSLPLVPSDKVVMQNPNNYIDIWNDWSIKKIELYYIDGRDPIEQNKAANIPDKIIASTTDLGCLYEFIELVKSSDDETEKFILPYGYVREHMYDGVGLSYYIRVYFNESENIIWDSQVTSFLSNESPTRVICVDNGRNPDGIASINSKDVNIGNYEKLFEWISDTIQSVEFE